MLRFVFDIVSRGTRTCFPVLLPVFAAMAFASGQRLFPKPEPESDPAVSKAAAIIEQHPDTMGKIAKLYQFLRQYPEAKSLGWARESLQQLLLEAGEWQRAMTVGQQIVASDPLDLYAAERTLEAARRLSDSPVAVHEARVLEIARKLAVAPLGKDAAPQWIERKRWAQRIAESHDRAEERDQYAAVLASSGAARIAAIAELLRKFPATAYRGQVLKLQLEAAQQLKDATQILTAAESLLEADPEDANALLAAAQIYLNQGRNPLRVEEYARKILAGRHEAEHAGFYVGSARLLLGSLYVGKQDFAGADRELRLARQYFKGARAAAVLFFLGYANYYLERYEEAAAFFEECSAHPGDYRQAALENIENMKRRGRTR